MKTAASVDWNLTFQNAQGTSHYLLHPDLSALLETDIPQTRLLAPTPEQIVGTHRPTIQWASPGGQVSVAGPLASVGTATWSDTYIPESDLPDGDYVADVTLLGGRVPLSLDVTLLDGPGGIGTFTFRSESTFDAGTEFSVVTPEPMSAGALLLCASALRRRARRRR